MITTIIIGTLITILCPGILLWMIGTRNKYEHILASKYKLEQNNPHLYRKYKTMASAAGRIAIFIYMVSLVGLFYFPMVDFLRKPWMDITANYVIFHIVMFIYAKIIEPQ